MYIAKQIVSLKGQWLEGIVLEKAPSININVHDLVKAIIDGEEIEGMVMVKTTQEHSVSMHAGIVKVNTQYMVRYQDSLGNWTATSIPEKFIIKKL